MSRTDPGTIALSSHLKGLPPREDLAEPLHGPSAARPVELTRPEQVTVVAVGLLMLERAVAHGGTRVPTFTLRELREQLTTPLSSREVMALEVEAYNTMSWIAGLSPGAVPAPQGEAVERGDTITYDPGMSTIDLLRRAIVEEFDVEIQYYTNSRGELTRRRISPHHIQAETYLHAYCHARLAERVFRISRISEMRPVDGKAVSAGSAVAPSVRQGTLDL